MTKYFYFFLVASIFTLNIFSQETNIPTEFSQDGKLFKNQNDKSVVVAQFEANEQCAVIGYLGKDNYKIKYKDWVGFVDSQYLMFNDDIDDLFYDYQDKERLKTIKQEELRKKKIRDIVNHNTDEKIEGLQDSEVKVNQADKQKAIEEEELARKQEGEQMALAKQELITKFLEEKKQKALEQAELARKQEEARIDRVQQDSIAKVREEKEKQEAFEKEALSKKQEVELKEREKRELIAKFLEEKKQKALAQEELARKQEAENIERAIQDSIAKLREDEEKQKEFEKEALSKKQEAEQKEREKRELIAKFLEEKKQKALAQEELAKKQEADARKIEEERVERAELDYIAKVKEAEKQKILAQEALAKKQEAVRMEKARLDSIAKVREVEKDRIENTEVPVNTIEEEISEQAKFDKIKFRSTCHYAMNEYDAMDRVKIIRTDPYNLSKNLSIELFKRGRSTNVFFNLKEDLGCASYLPRNRSYVKVRLENNQTITFHHSWDMDCGDFRFKGVISNSQMALLRRSPINSVFLKGTKNSSEITNIEYKEFFIDKLRCIE